MRAAIATVTVLAALAMSIQYGSTCRLTLNDVEKQGCLAFKFVQTPRKLNVCGQNGASCQSNGEGIVDGSVQLTDFKVDRSRCRLYRPYAFYKSFFRGQVTNADITLTGKHRDSSGQEQDFEASLLADINGYIFAREVGGCVRGLSNSFQFHRQRLQVIKGVLSKTIREELLKQLSGALREVVSETINSASRILAG